MAKFKTLIHNGPLFPEEYQVKGFMLANEKLSSLAEEMLWNYSAKRDTDYVKIERFNKNFYSCLKPELTKEQQKLNFPNDYKKLIDDMFSENQKLKEIKNNSKPKKVSKREFKLAENDLTLLKSLKSRQEKYDQLEAEKEVKKEKYGYAILDGQKEPLGAFMIEPPGIIMTRGDSSILGMWKYRTVPEDVIINYVDKDMSKAPKAPEGHRWKEIISDTNSFQTVMYFVQIGRPEFGINPRYKRIIFAATSSIKADNDQEKFEKARKLILNWDAIEKHIMKGLLSFKDPKRMEAATIASLIKTTGIRVGNAKNANDGFADTVGVSTFKIKNIKLLDNYKIKLSFIGKDSVPYENTIQLDQFTYNDLKKIIGDRNKNELVFTKATSADVSDFLKEFMPECSPKLFRSAYGCKLISEEIHKMEVEGKLNKSMTLTKKLAAYDNANLAVAKKLNHQRALPKNFDNQMQKLDEQIEESIKKEAEIKAKAEKELKETLAQAALAKKEWSGEKLKQALQRIKERKAKIVTKVEKSKEKIEKLKEKREFKDKTKNYALGTSKSAYSTPALAVAICKKFDIPIDKIYSKSLQNKFSWAMNAPESYYDNFPKEEYK